jgi:hypothetical protein
MLGFGRYGGTVEGASEGLPDEKEGGTRGRRDCR